MKIKIIAMLMAALVLPCAFAGGGGEKSTSTAPYTIEVGGSTSVTPLMEMFAHEYAKIKPNVKVNINGTGSRAERLQLSAVKKVQVPEAHLKS